MRNVKYYRWNNEMGKRERGGEDRKGEGGRTSEAPLFDISYSTFSAVAAAAAAKRGDELNYKHGMEGGAPSSGL